MSIFCQIEKSHDRHVGVLFGGKEVLNVNFSVYVTNLGCVGSQYHTNNEQTQSDECIICFNEFLQRGYSQLHNTDEYR